MPSHLNMLFTADFYMLPDTVQQDIYYEFYQLIYPLVFFILKDHGMAEDVIQESFLRAIRKACQLQDVDKIEYWLKTLARNVTYNYWRKNSRIRGELESGSVFINAEASHAGSATPVDREVELRLMKKAISGYLDQLKPEYRQLIEMRWIHNLSYKEMAATLNVSEGTVKQKLYRAREAVKRKFIRDWHGK